MEYELFKGFSNSQSFLANHGMNLKEIQRTTRRICSNNAKVADGGGGFLLSSIYPAK